MNSSLLILLLLPFIGSVITFIAGKFKKSLAFWLAEIIGITLFLSVLYIFFTFSEPIDIEIEWFTFGETTLPFGIYIDHLSLVMLLIATGLGALDIHFAHDYMANEKDQPRYYAKVLFFIGGMILLVSAKELIGLFVGWEFMGLASYLLISFWHQNRAPADAGVSAFLYTKFGDIFLFASLGLLFYFTGTLDMVKLNQPEINGMLSNDVTYMIAVFIFIAAIGKSGQFPLFPWLMRAMEGPTTVSALIHGATMVNSGIYIVARLFDFYVAAEALIVVAAFAALSAFIGATSALVQDEMKKVLAYSTMSHLSLAFLGLGAGSLVAGMSHLVNHAIFKALLFLGAGAVIMSAHHVKDLWRLGGLEKKLFLVAIFMGMGVLSLSGVPPFSGFFSKDAVLASAVLNPQTTGLISTLGIIAGILSIAYAGRLWMLIFTGMPRDKELYKKTTTPSNLWITLPLGIMAVVTLALGFFQDQLIHFISDKEHIEIHLKWLLPFMMTTISIVVLIIYYFYYRRPDLREKVSAQPLMKTIRQILFNGYYIEAMINWIAKSIVVDVIAKGINWSEKQVIDAAVNSMVKITHFIFTLFSKTHSSKVSNQAGAMLLGVLTIVVTIFIGSVI
jgi:NADH-quinone oxidoreductase subunit L